MAWSATLWKFNGVTWSDEWPAEVQHAVLTQYITANPVYSMTALMSWSASGVASGMMLRKALQSCGLEFEADEKWFDKLSGLTALEGRDLLDVLLDELDRDWASYQDTVKDEWWNGPDSLRAALYEMRNTAQELARRPVWWTVRD